MQSPASLLLRPEPRRAIENYAWTISSITSARTAHLGGDVARGASLAAAMRTDSAIYCALVNRIAPALVLPKRLAGGSRADVAREGARTLVGVEPGDAPALSAATTADLVASLVMCGLGVGVVDWTPRADGSRLDPTVRPWPLEAVEVDSDGALWARLDDASREPISHGDGRWLVVAHHTHRPWSWGAIGPLAVCWADRAYGVRDRASNSAAHGVGKPIGQLPKEIAIDSPQGQAFATLLQRLGQSGSGGIIPTGATAAWLSDASRAWEIFREIVGSNNSDIAKILLGQDSTVSNSGGNYVKSAVLANVRGDLTEEDVRALGASLTTGLVAPWVQLNWSTSIRPPSWVWEIPDNDEEVLRTERDARHVRYTGALQAYRAAGAIVDQQLADRLAEDYQVEPITLASDTVEATPAAA